MIKNNYFYIKNLQNIVIFGESKIFQDIVNINQQLNLKTIFITSNHQSKIIDKKIKYKIFNKIDNKTKKYLKNKVNVSETLFVSMGARYIFTKHDIINFFKENLINFHGTRLPLDAGSGTHSWKIMREDRIDTQLAHVIDSGIDTGSILDFKSSIYPKNCKIPLDYENYRLEKFKILYKEIISNIKNKKKYFLKKQINFSGRYNPRLNTVKNGFINWQMNSYDLYNFINAFDEPYEGASTYLNNGKFGKLRIKSVHLHGGDSSNHPFMSGLVNRHDKDWIVVGTTGKHMLLIEKVCDGNNKNIISKIKPGDRFFTPITKLDNAIKIRVKVNSKGFN